ncbi:MAG TPA: prepilin peptidase [Acetobacteraceae bacterium]|nr:prepilin peptidase [Acetobacteraceae bacterium]
MPGHLAFWIHWLGPPLAALLLVYAAAHDLAVRTIPNTIPAGLAIAGLAMRSADGSLPLSLLATALLGTGCGVCWWRGWLGGGDVKLLAALTLMLPPQRVLPAVIAVAWCGVALALPYAALRRRIAVRPLHRPLGLLARICRAERFRLRRGGPLPYGLAIAAGGLLELLAR